MNFFNIFGYESLTDLKASAFEHKNAFIWSGFGSAFAMSFNSVLGFSHIVGIAILALFILELSTGLGYSIVIKKEEFNVSKFCRAWIKLFVYVVMLGVTNIIAVEMEKKETLS